MNNKINVIMAINEKFILPTRVTIASLIANKGDELVDIYILHFNISISGAKLLESDSTDTVKIKCIQIDQNEIPNVKIYFEFSKEIMIKLFAYKYLPINIEKAIWLDSDLIILKSLSDFNNIDVKDYIFVAYEEPNIKKKEFQRLSLPNDYKYFNVGVMLINLAYMRANNCGNEIVNFINDCKMRLLYPEQDVANILYGLTDKAKIIGYPYQYNRLVNTIYKNELKSQNIAVLHYIGFHQKPWKGCACRHYNIWWKYAWNIKEYRALYFETFPKFLNNYLKKIFVKVSLLLKGKED